VYLKQNSEMIRSHGILYPDVDLHSDAEPKHQWVVSSLLSGDLVKFRIQMRKVIDLIRPSTKVVLLSTEGIYNHWQDFSAESISELKEINDYFDVVTWTWYREPAEFLRSYYLQNLRNAFNEQFLYGLDMSVIDFIHTDRIKNLLNYEKFRAILVELFGESAVFSFAYSPNIISEMQRMLNLPRFEVENNQNVTELNKFGVEMMRVANRYPFRSDDGKRVRMYRKIVEICQAAADVSPPFALDESEQAAVRQCSSPPFSIVEALCESDALRWRQFWAGCD